MKKILTLKEARSLYPHNLVKEEEQTFSVRAYNDTEPDLTFHIPKTFYFLGDQLIDPLNFLTDRLSTISRTIPLKFYGTRLSFLCGHYEDGNFRVEHELDYMNHILLKIEWDIRQGCGTRATRKCAWPLVCYSKNKITCLDRIAGEIAGIDYYVFEITRAVASELVEYFMSLEMAYETAASIMPCPTTGWETP